MADKKVKIIYGTKHQSVAKEIEDFCKSYKVLEIKQHSEYSAVIFYEEQEE